MRRVTTYSSHISAIVDFLICNGKESVEILHLRRLSLLSRSYLVLPTNVSYHLIHLVIILISVRLCAYNWRLHLSMVTPHQVVRHKSFLTKVNLDLILSQKPIVPTNCAGALCNTTTISKSFIQEFINNSNTFCRVSTFLTESIVHRPSVVGHLQY
jgi:hypothetical protein